MVPDRIGMNLSINLGRPAGKNYSSRYWYFNDCGAVLCHSADVYK